MRLVDADKLKEALSSKDLITWTYEYGDAIPVDWLMSTIDNAPTIENITIFRGCDNCELERPKGEWIVEHLPKNINNLNDCYECASCSECGFHYDYMYRYSNYCPNCGADMRKNTSHL